MSESFTQVMTLLRRTSDVATVKSDINHLYRTLNVLERRERLEADPDVARLADAVLGLAQIKGRLATARAKAEAGDPAATVALLDVDRLDADIDAKLKSHCKLIGDYAPYLDRVAWARRTLRRFSERQTAPPQRPTARRSGAPVSPTTQRASERFAKLLARYGLKAKSGTGEVGFDVDCGCRYRARGQTFVRRARCGKSTCIAPGTLSWDAVEQSLAATRRR